MKMEAASSYRSRPPPGICTRTVHGLDTERFIKPVRHWFDGLRITLFPLNASGKILRIPVLDARVWPAAGEKDAS